MIEAGAEQLALYVFELPHLPIMARKGGDRCVVKTTFGSAAFVSTVVIDMDHSVVGRGEEHTVTMCEIQDLGAVRADGVRGDASLDVPDLERGIDSSMREKVNR